MWGSVVQVELIGVAVIGSGVEGNAVTADSEGLGCQLGRAKTAEELPHAAEGP